jgi:hypothetical protein
MLDVRRELARSTSSTYLPAERHGLQEAIASGEHGKASFAEAVHAAQQGVVGCQHLPSAGRFIGVCTPIPMPLGTNPAAWLDLRVRIKTTSPRFTIPFGFPECVKSGYTHPHGSLFWTVTFRSDLPPLSYLAAQHQVVNCAQEVGTPMWRVDASPGWWSTRRMVIGQPLTRRRHVDFAHVAGCSCLV